MTLHRFVVPIRNVSTFCTFLDGQLRPENPLPMVANGEHAIDAEFGWVAWVAEDGAAIGRTHLDAVEGEGGFAPLVMPEGYRAACLLFHRQVLFVGGNCGNEVIGAFDLAAPEPRWVPLDVPPQFQRYGKEIDDLLLDGDRLLAVDDIVSPKYLLRYDVDDPRRPRLMDVLEIPWHSSYETIHSGALGTNWVALLSSSVNHGWAAVHIALFDRVTLEEQGALTKTRKGSYRRAEEPDTRDWRGLAFHGNVLLVAAGADGVGVLDLDALKKPPVQFRGPDANDWSAPPEIRTFSEQCMKALRHQPLPVPYAGRPVTRVVPVTGTRHFLAVVGTDPGFDTVVMELS
ncbi:MAG: hypothetical protein J0I06_02090 [Planctomycetes bacterium]|nr:hypothetical protein [Planctomycetota bacterium]